MIVAAANNHRYKKEIPEETVAAGGWATRLRFLTPLMLARDAMLYRELAQMEFMWAKGWMTTLAFKYENGCNR